MAPGEGTGSALYSDAAAMPEIGGGGPCRPYDGTVCETGDKSCKPAPAACVYECTSHQDCGPGHPCVDLFNEVSPTYCHTACESSLCPTDQECKGSECAEVFCGAKVKCKNKASICDTWAQACYPINGSCAAAENCPGFDQSAVDFGQTVCADGFCRIIAKPPPPPKGLEDKPTFTMLQPTFGAELANHEEVVFEWLGSDTASILLVLDRLPAHSGELLHAAIWGRMIAAKSATKAKLAGGHAIVDGKWQKASPKIPIGKPLYAIVQRVGGGSLAAVSLPVPFIIGAPWPAVGAKCSPDADGEVMGPCANPKHLQQCVAGVCRRVCLSNLDCSDVGFDCGPVVDGLRLCL